IIGQCGMSVLPAGRAPGWSIARLEERLVEEADDPLLILPRPRVEAADMFCLVDPPNRLRFRGTLEIIGVQLLAAPSVRGVDQKKRARADLRDHLVKCRWRWGAAHYRECGRLDGRLWERQPAPRTAEKIFPNRPHAGSFGDDGA